MQNQPGGKTNLHFSTEFIGREVELQEILHALNSSTRAWIISLTGVGGIGKTELAIKAASLAYEQRHFTNVIWTTAKDSWLTYEGIEPFSTQYPLVSLDDLLDTIIRVLNMDAQVQQMSPERKKEQVRNALKQSPSLLIVDNLETIQDNTIIQFLTRELPHPAKALVTTRAGGLSAPDATVAQKLEGQREIRVGPFSREDAIAFFIRKAEMQNLYFSREHDLAKLEMIVDRAAYIPLALEWIVGKMQMKNDSLDRALEQLSANDSEILRYCFNNLMATAGKRAEKVLLAVSLFVDTVGKHTLQEITELPPEQQDEELERLKAVSLIDRIEERYRVPAPTRLYVNALRRQVPDLYQDYCVRAAENMIMLLNEADKTQSWGPKRIEQHNILAIFSWCIENDQLKLALELAQPLSTYLQRLGLWDQRAYVCELATHAATKLGDEQKVAEFTYDAAEIHKARGRLDEALDEFKRCEDYSQRIGDKVKEAHAHMQAGIILYHKEKYAESIRVLQQSIKLHRASKDELGIAQNLTILGRNALQLNNMPEALKYFEESLDIKLRIRDQLGAAISQYDLGHLYHLEGNHLKAQQLFEESISAIEHLDERRHQSNAKWYYALLQIDRENYEAARDLLTDVLYIEELLQRDDRFARADALRIEVERQIAQKTDTRKSGELGLSKFSDQTKFADLVENIMALLLKSMPTSSLSSTSHHGLAAEERAKSLLAELKRHWSKDTYTIGDLERFEENPDRYGSFIKSILHEKLVNDQVLIAELQRILLL